MSKIDKDKLYTVNKWNRVAFMPENVFGNGDQMNVSPIMSTNVGPTMGINGEDAVRRVNSLNVDSGASGKTTGSWKGKGLSWAGAAPGVGMGWMSALQDRPEYSADAHNGFSLVDSTLAGGRRSQVGMGLVNSGASIMNKGLESGNGIMALVGGIAGTVGTGINWLAGKKVDEAGLARAEASIGNNRNYKSNAGYYDDVKDIASTTNTNVYEGGVLSSADEDNDELRDRMLSAWSWADRSRNNNIYNISADQLSDALGNYSAFGGPIGRSAVIQPYTGQDNTNNMGAIEYGFMSDYLTQKKQQNEVKNKMSGFSPVTMFALGGDTQTHGADWTSGLMTINAGKSHEENPNDGVQLGRDNQGVPNLVEEGETVYNDYVYSNRIYADGGTLQKFNLPKKAKLTFADISKKLGKEIKERENDAISQAGYRVQMQDLADEQERQKQEMEAERAKAAFEALSPEEQVALMEEVSARENLAAQAEQEQAIAQQAMQQPSPEEAAMMQQQQMMQEQAVPEEQMAYGGNLFAGGGELALNWLKENNDLNLSDDELKSIASAMGKYIEKNYPNLSPDSINMSSVYSKFFKGWSMTPDAYGQNYRDMRSAGISKDTALKMLKARKQWSKDSKENDKQWETIAAKWEPKGTSQSSNTAKYYRDKNGKLHNTREEAVKANYEALMSRKANQDAALKQQDIPAVEKQAVAQSAPEAVNEKASEKAVNSPVPSEKVDSGLNPYEWYRNGSDGQGQPWGFTVGSNGLIDTETGYTDEYKNLVKTLGAKDIKEWATQHPDDPSLQSFLARNYDGDLSAFIADDKFTDDIWRKGATDGKYGFMHHVSSEIGKNNILDELGVDRSALDASLEDSRTAVENMMRTPQVYHAMDGDAYDGYIEGEPDPTVVGAETRRETLPNGDVVIYHGKAGGAGTISSNAGNTDAQNTEKKYVPVLRKEWPRYAGLFGPAVGLGMMAAGIGKPDYSELDAALRSAGDVALADYQPIGNYLTYRPMDIWYEQNRLNANARATDRAIMNTAGTNRGNALAGLIANGYNSQLASGDLYRKALEYNDSLEKQVENFNRGTDMFNAQAYNQNQQFNAGARNQGRSARANLAANIAGTKLNADANWYNSLYGNVSGLFKGVSDLGRENADRNWIARLAASGYFGTLNNAVNAGLVKEVSAEGGKLKRKKNKRRGLTF